MKEIASIVINNENHPDNANRAKSVCPFTDRRCTKCSLYRGRHCNYFYKTFLISEEIAKNSMGYAQGGKISKWNA